MFKTSENWQRPCSDISWLPNILGCLPSAPADSAAWNTIYFFCDIPWALFGMWEMPVEVLPRWSQSSISQNTTAARCKVKCTAAKSWEMQICVKRSSPGSGRRNLHLIKPRLMQKLLKLMEEVIGFKGEKPETPQMRFYWIFWWGTSNTRTLIFQDVPRHVWEINSSLGGKGGQNPQNRGSVAEHLNNTFL